jgi:hypothetical protein
MLCRPAQPRLPHRASHDGGQAATELVAILPLLALLAALLWQIALVGHATWAAGAAAGAAARAHAVGRDAAAAGRARLPRDLRAGLRVRERSDGSVHVAVPIPSLAPGLSLGRASATAHYPAQRS